MNLKRWKGEVVLKGTDMDEIVVAWPAETRGAHGALQKSKDWFFETLVLGTKSFD